MIGIGQSRKNILDNNNYIGKYGNITHVCPHCSNLYEAEIMLKVTCNIESCCCDRNGYSVTTPEINKECACGTKTTQVDNAMGKIVKAFIEKGYVVVSCCEGHAYANDAVLTFDLPQITIQNNIIALIPSRYRNTLDIEYDYTNTIIKAKECCNQNSGCCPCQGLEEYNECKEGILEIIGGLVNSLPNCPFTKTSNKNYGCNCNTQYPNCQ